jgi:predicted alpha/beta superfamily hydrolase
VTKWRRIWLPCKSTFLFKAHLISEEFESPQLNKIRRVCALLLKDYETSNESWVVLYLHDVQNLVKEKAEYGSWKIDRKYVVMSEYNIGELIVI